ncbi:MAG: hypothetical protein MUE85_23040 [Microscillaceae bacterium]|nr:hypothetical protein [Microscillaceae bacterium]
MNFCLLGATRQSQKGQRDFIHLSYEVFASLDLPAIEVVSNWKSDTYKFRLRDD